MDILGQLNYGIGVVNEKSFKDIKVKRVNETIELKPEMFDYIIGNKSSLRYEWIKEIKDNQEKINEMVNLLMELLPIGLPEEFYDWYARECLGLQYKKHEIRNMKRKYKLERRRKLEKKKKEEKLKKNRMGIENKKVVLKF
jgi:hypothetical protein